MIQHGVRTMHIMDWNGYRDQVLAGVGQIGKLTPETTRGYAALSNAGAKTGHLDASTRELIAAACAVSLRCDGRITVHTKAAREAGASDEELAEALGVAIALSAGAGLVYSTRAMDAFGAEGEG